MIDDNNNIISNQILIKIIIDGSVLIFCRLKKEKQVVKVQMKEVNDVDNDSEDRTG